MVKDVSTIFSAEITDKQQLNYLNISKNLILRNINNIRSNFQFNENQDKTEPNVLPPMKESYCHAFFRILGLPVISADKTKFYNPGFYGNEIGQIEIERRNSIDRFQDQTLFSLETAREFINYGNSLNFESESTKYQYRFELLKQPMSVNLLDENKGPFDYDQQIDNVSNRDTYKPVQKILRPFKCVPNLINKVIPATNMICAPFVSQPNSKLRNSILTRPYIEFVSRIRLSKDITSNTAENKLSEALSQKIEGLNIESVLSSFIDSVKNLSTLELYVIEQLFITLIDACNKINREKKAAQELVAKMESRLEGENIQFTNDGVVFDTLEKWIQERQQKIAEKELLLSQIPGFTIPGIGEISNKIHCILTNPFIELVQPDLENLRKELETLNKEKQKRVKAFNSMNSELFYLIGEVNGLGLIDILVMMLSFWLISSEELISMFDEESFNRLLLEPSLYSDVVERRIQNGPLLGISEVMESFDKNVTLLLKLADSVVESEKAT